MPIQGSTRGLAARLDDLAQSGRLKGKEAVISSVIAGHDGHGPRYAIEGDGRRPFLRMNSNSYLGMALRAEVIKPGKKPPAFAATAPGPCPSITATRSTLGALKRRLRGFHCRSHAA